MKEEQSQPSQSQSNRKVDSLQASARLESLKSDAATAEGESGSQFMKPDQKRGRGRPKGSTSKEGPQKLEVMKPQIDQLEETKQLTGPLVKLYSNTLVQIAEDERARLDGETEKTMVSCSAVVINQYFGGIGMHAALITLVMVTASTSFNAWKLRMENLEKLRAEKRRQDQTRANGTAGPAQPVQ